MVEKKEEEKGICERLEKNKFSLTTRVKVDVMNGSAKRVMEGGKESYIPTYIPEAVTRQQDEEHVKNIQKHTRHKIITV